MVLQEGLVFTEVVKEDMPFWYELGCDVRVYKLQEGGRGGKKKARVQQLQNLNKQAS